jgi:hypothetical protein
MIPLSKNCTAIVRSCFASVAMTPRLSSGTCKKKSETRVAPCSSRLRSMSHRGGLGMLAAEVLQRISKGAQVSVDGKSGGRRYYRNPLPSGAFPPPTHCGSLKFHPPPSAR